MLGLLLLTAGHTRAEDEARGGSTPKKPTTVETGTRAVLDALTQGDADALRALADLDVDEPRPLWLIAWLLCERGQHAAATQLAAAVDGPHVKGIAAYVASRATEKPDAERLAFVLELVRAIEANDESSVKALLKKAAPPGDAVATIYIDRMQAWLARQGDDVEASVAATLAVARRARELGWLSLALGEREQAFLRLHAERSKEPAHVVALENVALATQMGGRRRQVNALRHLSKAAVARGDSEGARDAAQKAVELATKGTDTEGLAFSLMDLADVLTHAGSWDQVDQHLIAARRIFEERKAQRWIAWCHLRLADMAIRRSRTKQAETGASKALKIGMATKDRDVVGSSYMRLGEVHWSREDRPGALKAFERAKAQFEKLGARSKQAVVLRRIAAIHAAQGAVGRARAGLRAAIEIHRAEHDARLEAWALYDLAYLERSVHQFPKALPLAKRALVLARKAGELDLLARSASIVANLHDDLGDYAAAVIGHRESLAHFRTLGSQWGIVLKLQCLGVSLGKQGELEASIDRYRQALAFATERGLTKYVVTTASMLARTLVEHARRDEAEPYMEQAGSALAATKDTNAVLEGTRVLGTLLKDVARYAAAEEVALRGAKVAEAAQRPLEHAHLQELLGHIRGGRGDLTGSLRARRRALALFDGLGHEAGIGVSLENLARALWNRGDLPKARKRYEQAAAQYRKQGAEKRYVALLPILADIRGQLGDAKGARAFSARALRMAQKLGDPETLALVEAELGRIAAHRGDTKTARPLLERALAYRQSKGLDHASLSLLKSLASLRRKEGAWRAAKRDLRLLLAHSRKLGAKQMTLLTRLELAEIALVHELQHAEVAVHAAAAVELAKATGSPAGLIRALRLQASSQWELREHDAALRTLDRAIRAARRLRHPGTLVSVLRRAAHLRLIRGEPERALAFAQEGLQAMTSDFRGQSDARAAELRAQNSDTFALGALAAMQLGDPAEAVQFLESGRAGALLEALDSKDVLRGEQLPELLRALDRSTRERLAVARSDYESALKRRNHPAIRAASRTLDAAQDARQALVGRIQRDVKQQADLLYPHPETLEAMQGALADGEALVIIGFCLNSAVAVVVEKETERVADLGTAEHLRSALARFEAHDVDAKTKEARAALRARLIAPLKLPASVKRVIISPEGPLCFAPFGALLDRPITLVPSGTTWLRLLEHDGPRGKGRLALGAPDYAGTSEEARALYWGTSPLVALPESGKEAGAIGTKVLLGPKATEQGLREALAAHERWQAIHLACHAMVDPERPGFSALALTAAGADDGFLTALEIVRMKIHADLVSLSACQTGRGQIVTGEGILGLTRAFMHAGAPRVLCSLWNVDDDATRELMVKFYELWGKGVPAAKALAASQAHVRATPKWEHPYYWAAWVLWGLPR